MTAAVSLPSPDTEVLVAHDRNASVTGAVVGIDSSGVPMLRPDLSSVDPGQLISVNRADRRTSEFLSAFGSRCRNPENFTFYHFAADKVGVMVRALSELVKSPVEYGAFLRAHMVTPEGMLGRQASLGKDVAATDAAPVKAGNVSLSESDTHVRSDHPVSERPRGRGDAEPMPDDRSLIESLGLRETWGVDPDELSANGDLKAMLNHGKSRLMDCTVDVGGIRFPIQARLSIEKVGDAYRIRPHAVRRWVEKSLPGGAELSSEDRERLLSEGHLGRLANAVSDGETVPVPSFVSLDRQTNEIVCVPAANIRIPETLRGVTLSQSQRDDLAAGRSVSVSGMTSSSGRLFDASVTVSAERRGLEFRYSDPGHELRRARSVLGVPVSDSMRKEWASGRWVYVQGMVSRRGERFDAWVRPNSESGRYEFSHVNPGESVSHSVSDLNRSERKGVRM